MLAAPKAHQLKTHFPSENTHVDFEIIKVSSRSVVKSVRSHISMIYDFLRVFPSSNKSAVYSPRAYSLHVDHEEDVWTSATCGTSVHAHAS